MSGAASARDAIRLALTAGYGPVFAAGKSYASAYQQAISKTDLMDALGHAVHLVAAAAHLHEVAEAAEKDARHELARVMDEVGCTSIAAGTLTAYLSKRPPYVAIDDPKLIPSEYLHQPPPIPNKAAIKKAIEGGAEIPGAALVRPNEQQLSIRSKK